MLRREDHPHHAADAVADEDVRDESKLPVAIAHDFCVLPEAYGLPRLFRVAVVEDIEGEDLILLLERVRELVEAVSVHLHTVKKDQLGPSAAPEEVVELVAPLGSAFMVTEDKRSMEVFKPHLSNRGQGHQRPRVGEAA